MTTMNPRDLQVGTSHPNHASARALAAALIEAGVPSAVHQFPEFNGNWWAVCVDRKSQLETAQKLVAMYDAGFKAASNR